MVDWRNRDQLHGGWWVLRGVCRLIRDIDGWFSFYADKVMPRQYRIVGSCHKRGVCCHRIGIGLTPTLARTPWITRWVTRWIQFVYHFEPLPPDPHHRMLFFKCRYLQGSQCGIYRDRPMICRRYPQPRYFGKPVFLPGCGYAAEKRT
ncbi:YkgJ family cysteine cluster protein [bacterium]|nr:YkgJ family cysteine cluster protein [bacterium]